MLIIGAHITIAKGFSYASKSAIAMGANTFQFFSRNPRGSSSKELDTEDIEEFQNIRIENHFGPIMAHSPYTMNLASNNQNTYCFAIEVLKEDIKKMDSLGIEYFNIHPGSYTQFSIQDAISQVIKAINECLTQKQKLILLIETMSGKGTEIGSTFEQIHEIIKGVQKKDKIGVCMDLCHVFSAGYPIHQDINKVLTEFDDTIGLNYLKAIHLNDSMMEFESYKDRHAPIGEGKIGIENIINIMKHPMLKQLPFYLETPVDNVGHKREIDMIKKLLKK